MKNRFVKECKGYYCFSLIFISFIFLFSLTFISASSKITGNVVLQEPVSFNSLVSQYETDNNVVLTDFNNCYDYDEKEGFSASIFNPSFVLYNNNYYLDSCIDADNAREYYCGVNLLRWDFWNAFKEKFAKVKPVKCEFGCKDNACLPFSEIPGGGNGLPPETPRIDIISPNQKVYDTNIISVELAVNNEAYMGLPPLPTSITTREGVNISDPNLVAYWSLDNDYSDALGRANGVCTSCPISTPGFIGGAMKFDGISQYLNLTLNNLIFKNLDKDMTECAWVKFDSLKAINFLGYAVNQTGAGGYDKILGINSAFKPTFYIYSSGIKTATGITTIAANKWYFLCGRVKSGSGNSIFVNGVNENTNTAYTSQNFPGSYYLGTNMAGAANFFNGSIDEVLIYNRSLSDVEIMQLYKMGFPPEYTSVWFNWTKKEVSKLVVDSNSSIVFNSFIDPQAIGAKRSPDFTLDKSYFINRLFTWHWDSGGNYDIESCNLSIVRARDNFIIGNYYSINPAYPAKYYGGNFCYPNVSLPAGTYYINSTNCRQWMYTSPNVHRGFVKINASELIMPGLDRSYYFKTMNLTLPMNGEYTLFAYAKDNSGNVISSSYDFFVNASGLLELPLEPEGPRKI